MNLKTMLYKQAKQGKSSFIEELSQNKELDFSIRDMENDQIISVYDKDNNFINEYEFDEGENYLDPLDRNVSHTFTLYNRLSPAQRTHLLDFTIINAIESCEKEFKQDEKERLLEIINDAYLDDENHIDRTTIADEIVEAYANGEVSLKTLEESGTTEILDCIVGIGSFESLEEELEDEEEDEEEE